MWKKIIVITIILAGLLLLPNDAGAIQINLALGKDIVSNQDKLNISYELYFADSSVVQHIKGMNQNVFVLWLHAFNQENRNMLAIDTPDKPSHISLGYNKNGEDFAPGSCQDIQLSNVDVINIALTENSCSIN